MKFLEYIRGSQMFTSHLLRLFSFRPISIFIFFLVLVTGHATNSAIAENIVHISATSPHLANGIDKSTVTVTVTNEFGQPVTNADIALDISPPVFVNQLSHFVLHLNAPHVSGGRYVASFASPEEGPLLIVATDRVSLASSAAFVEFSAVVAQAAPAGAAPAVDAKENCKKYFDKLDEEFYPPILSRRITAAADPLKAALRERLDDVRKIMGVIQADVVLETKIARGEVPTQAEKDALEKAKQDNKASFTRNAAKQEGLLKEFFGDPIDFTKYQACTELFNNFKLVTDFDDAIKRITRPPPPAPGKIVERGPDASIAHIRWAKFANIAIDLDINKELWRNLKAILAKGSAITVAVLSDNDPTKAGIQPAMQSDAQITALRTVFDALKPKNTDTEEEKKKKVEEIEKKLIDLIKTISVDKKVIAQLPGRDGNSVLLATITSATCLNGNEQALLPQISSAVTLSRLDDALFGFGADNSGATYVAVGSVTGSQASFAISGFGLTPGMGPANNAFQGLVQGDSIVGTWQGIADGSLAGQANVCTWSGDFRLTPRARCDFDGDGDVDRNDVNTLFSARNTPASIGDLRDVDSDGLVTVNDARVCTLACTNTQCANFAFNICTPQRISTGFATAVTACTVAPAARANCQIDNRTGSGGVSVHCQAAGVATVTIKFLDSDAMEKTVVHTVNCK